MVQLASKPPHEIAYDLFKFLLKTRNSDGTWGSSPRDKCSWTSQVLQAFMELGVPKNSELIQKGLKYLKEEINREQVESEGFWHLRVPALLKMGENRECDADVRELLRLIKDELLRPPTTSPKQERAHRLYWEAVNLHILHKHNIPVDSAIREHVASEICKELILEGGKAKWKDQDRLNWTTAAALFLNDFPNKYAKEVQACIRYILSPHRPLKEWKDYIGITAYVIMDLVELGLLKKGNEAFQEILKETLGDWVRKQNSKDGGMPEDPIGPLTSKDRRYTTALALRAIIASNKNTDFFRNLTGLAMSEIKPRLFKHLWTSLVTKIERSHNLRKIAYVISLLMVFALIYLSSQSIFGVDLLINLASSAIGAALWFLVIKIFQSLRRS